MFNINVELYTQKDIPNICRDFEKYKSIKYIKKVYNKYNNGDRVFYRTYDTYTLENNFVVYYNEDEYIAECLLYGDIIKKVAYIDNCLVKYKKM